MAVFYNLPPGALDALMQCAVSSLSLQERYSLVATCTFLVRQRSCRFRCNGLRDNLVRKRSSGALREAMTSEKRARSCFERMVGRFFARFFLGSQVWRPGRRRRTLSSCCP